MQNQSNRKITFDTQLKTALLNTGLTDRESRIKKRKLGHEIYTSLYDARKEITEWILVWFFFG